MIAAVQSAAAAPAGASAVDPQVHDAARQLEGIFVSMLLDRMLASSPLVKQNPIYSGLATQALGDRLAEAGGIGLAAMLERQLGGVS